MTKRNSESLCPDILLKNISKSYPGKTVLQNLNQTFLSGHAYCIMAPSGTGKTTLLRILCGLEKPDCGQITGTEHLRFSVVFQEDRLLEGLSAIENIRFSAGKNIAAEEVQKLIKDFLSETDFKKSVSEYSGGMCRKVCLLRALLTPSDMLLLDEPFSGLDEDSRKKAVALIQKYRNGRTLFVSTHDSRDAARLDAEIISLIS